MSTPTKSPNPTILSQVPNSQTLAGFGIGALPSVTVGVFWFWATLLLGPLKRIPKYQKLFASKWDMVLTPFRPPMNLNWSTNKVVYGT